MPIPSGLIGVSSRANVLNVYYEVYVASPTVFWRNKNRIGGSWISKISPSTNWTSKSTPQTSWTGKTTPTDGSTQVI